MSGDNEFDSSSLEAIESFTSIYLLLFALLVLITGFVFLSAAILRQWEINFVHSRICRLKDEVLIEKRTRQLDGLQRRRNKALAHMTFWFLLFAALLAWVNL